MIVHFTKQIQNSIYLSTSDWTDFLYEYSTLWALQDEQFRSITNTQWSPQWWWWKSDFYSGGIMNLFSIHYMHSFSIRLRKAISSHSINQKIQMAESEHFQQVDWISPWGRKHCFQINFWSTLKISRAICLKILPMPICQHEHWAFGFHALTIKYKLCCDLWWLKGSAFSDRRERCTV